MGAYLHSQRVWVVGWGVGGVGRRPAGAEQSHGCRLNSERLAALSAIVRIVRQFAVAEWLQRRSDDDVDELLK